jgi:site-specific recombinase XerD
MLCSDKDADASVFGLNYRSLGMKIKEWANKAGVPIHTHSFRHYFATKLVEKGANIRVAQELLGHSSLNTTQVYLSVTANHLEEAIGLLDD